MDKIYTNYKKWGGRLSKDRIRSEYETNKTLVWKPYSSVYDLMKDAPFVKELRERYVQVLHGLELALDAGCGTGLISVELATDVRRVIGMDISPEMLAKAASRLNSLNNVRLCAADVHRLPFSDAVFDGYLLNNVLYFVDDPKMVISEMVRVTKHGGIIALASARPSNNVDVLIEGLLSYLKEEDIEVPAQDLEKFVESNRALQSQYRNLYEPQDISALLRKFGCHAVLEESTCYIDQNFFVVARR